MTFFMIAFATYVAKILSAEVLNNKIFLSMLHSKILLDVMECFISNCS